MRLPPLIGLAGRARTGKDTTAQFLLAQYGGYTYAFADPIRRMLKAGLGVDLNEPYWQARKEMEIPAIGCSPRQLLQRLGTEWGRELIHPDLWVILAADHLQRHGRGMIVTDVRMENEAAWVRRMGGTLIHLRRSAAAKVVEHRSENDLTVDPADFVLYNDAGLEDLQHAVSMLFDH